MEKLFHWLSTKYLQANAEKYHLLTLTDVRYQQKE